MRLLRALTTAAALLVAQSLTGQQTGTNAAPDKGGTYTLQVKSELVI